MTDLTISETRDYFTYAGKPFFYLADTVWPAFARISFDEWEEYLEYRRLQGFNVLQIMVSQDQSIFGNRPHAFHLDADGQLDYNRINEEFFERATKILAMATQKGFIPALAVLWADKVKDTWLSNLDPGRIMPLDAVAHYAEFVAKAFAEFNPIYFVSGDTNFESDETSEAYLIALDTIKSISPDALTTMHIWGDSAYLPEDIVQSSNLDFYVYQSGHKRSLQHFPYQFAQEFYKQPIKRPILNSEPCYEGLHGLLDWGQFEDYRFQAFDVRKAAWQSLLSGAKAGVSYGAYGVWPWHNRDEVFGLEKFFGKPFDWRTALHFKGAWDVSFAKWIFETHDLFDIEPQTHILNNTAEVRMSATGDLSKVVIYSPYATEVRLDVDVSHLDWRMIVLDNKHIASPEIEGRSEGSVFTMHQFNSDVLLVGKE